MWETLIPLIVTGLLSAAGGVGFWTWMTSRSERPLKRAEVENATATSLREVYGGVLDDLQSELKRQGEELTAQGNQIKDLRDEVNWQAATIERLRWAVRNASRYIDDLHDRWDWHRIQEEPPPKPPFPPMEE